MSGAEVIAVVACVAAVVSAYHDGGQLFSTIKRKWKQHRHPETASSEASTNDLEWSLRRGQEDILTQWSAHAGRLGRRFEDGDAIAREQMKDIVIELQRALLTNLRENNAHLDILSLLHASDRGRKDTIQVFHALYQRLAQVASIPWPMDSGPALIDPLSRLGYWINLIENQPIAQVPSSRYIQSLSSSPVGTVLSGGLTGSPPDTMGLLRQADAQSSPSQSRRSSRTSLGSIFAGRRRSSAEAGGSRIDAGSRFGSVGSGVGLTPMLEMPDHHAFIDQPRGGPVSSTGAYAAEIQDYIEQDRATAARLQQALNQEQRQNEMEEYRQQDKPPPAQRHDSMHQEPVQHEMEDDMTREMTANPWTVDAGPSPTENHWQEPSNTDPIPEPMSRGIAVDARQLSDTDGVWAQPSRPLPIPQPRRPQMMDTSPDTRAFIPRPAAEETIRQEHYAYARPVPPSHRHPHPHPGAPQRTRSGDAPIPVNTEASPPTRTPAPRTQHPPSIASTNSTTSTTSSNPSIRSCWPPSNDNNYAGFCKGAWKLHSGLGGFKVHSEPKGYYMMESKWRCANCSFEMPLAPDSDRQNPKYNNKLFIHAPTGIQFRWLFLAKSHMKCKRASGGAPKQARGPFGCIFCCRERGVAAPPGFESLEAFMLHLGAEHRFCVEETLLERACCIVGRVAGAEEAFDVNIPLPA
ncbi:uncharacterized protein N7482_009130 [Penicillium canariense]|uniref:Uncharacterized protein n=1 Tax=Penicillium canariense TaxID=189055 RepID=A0A9W9HPR1_9EURO|nr:uncharacterized protein N7482_009130 [Penicillium canariense]KAJ5152652.1 hypothetical protein N7482_009130 [Penicillium canariense]